MEQKTTGKSKAANVQLLPSQRSELGAFQNILEQVEQSVMAQADQSSQGVLSLLQ